MRQSNCQLSASKWLININWVRQSSFPVTKQFYSNHKLKLAHCWGALSAKISWLCDHHDFQCTHKMVCIMQKPIGACDYSPAAYSSAIGTCCCYLWVLYTLYILLLLCSLLLKTQACSNSDRPEMTSVERATPGMTSLTCWTRSS